VHREAEQNAGWTLIHCGQLCLEHVDPLTRAAEPVCGDPIAKAGQKRNPTALQPDEQHAGTQRKPEADRHRHGQRDITSMHKQHKHADGSKDDLGQELRCNIHHGGRRGLAQTDSKAGNRPYTGEKAADLRERQAVACGIPHHPTPNHDPQATPATRRKGHVPGSAVDQEQPHLPDAQQAKAAGADRQHGRQHTIQPEPANQERGQQQADDREQDRDFPETVQIIGSFLSVVHRTLARSR